MNDSAPLYSQEAEMGVLGSMILGEGPVVEEMRATLAPDDFFVPKDRVLFEGIVGTADLNEGRVDIVLLKDHLIAKGVSGGMLDYAIEVADYVPSPRNAKFYAKRVRKLSFRRRVLKAAEEIVGIAQSDDEPEDVAAAAERALRAASQGASSGSGFVSTKDLAQVFADEVNAVMDSGEPRRGLPTGFLDLDHMTGGYYGGELTIVGARPSMGKTSKALETVLNAARGIDREREFVAVFSAEMSGISLMRRMVSMRSGVSSSVLRRKGELTEARYDSLMAATDMVYSLPILIDDHSSPSPRHIRARLRSATGRPRLVVVDYIQLMHGDSRNSNRVQELGEVARGLKAISKEFDCPVVALAQLSRAVESRDDKRPLLSDLRDSGSIEAEADNVLLLYRASYYAAKEEGRGETDATERAEVIVAKHRNGPVGKVILGFQPRYARFVNLAAQEPPECHWQPELGEEDPFARTEGG